MLKQASIWQIRSGAIAKRDGYIVICMCFYPRGLRQDVRDEYRSDLAPDRALFKDWLPSAKSAGHDAAFAHSDYENRFTLSPKA